MTFFISTSQFYKKLSIHVQDIMYS